MDKQHGISPRKSEKEDSHRGLKAVVIGMGIALIGGLILLFALAYKKMTDPEAFAKKKPAIEAAAPTKCDLQAAYALPDGKISEMMTFETTVSFTMAREDGLEWLSIDRCSGEVLSHLRVTPKE